jgi:general secretion pathway protein G
MTHACSLTTRARGFTLLELLVVILIIGLLVGIVAPRLLGQVSKSEVTAARAQLDAITPSTAITTSSSINENPRAQLDAIDKAVQAFRMDTGHFPSTSQGLRALVTTPPDEGKWRGPYMQSEVPPDPWGSPYQYRLPGTNGRDYDLYSLGRDRAQGGSGDDADLYR